MRTAFIETIKEIAAVDERLWLLCGDLGFSVLEAFSEKFPERYLNVGVAEQNMTGIAAGLAMSGKVAFTYSIANFPVMRCLEQVRNDVCYHNQNVKIVAVGGGLAYASSGYSHHGTEDLAVMRVMPNMTVVAPGDPVETRLAVKAIFEHEGPCYLRLGKAKENIVHQSIPSFVLGKAIVLSEGKDITLISTGGMLESAVKAGEQLKQLGISAAVISMPTIQPLDSETIEKFAKATGRIVTLEEHGIGGLGSAVAEALSISRIPCWHQSLRLPQTPIKVAGSQEFLRAQCGLSIEDIVKLSRTMVKG